jgi:hypothetical protein
MKKLLITFIAIALVTACGKAKVDEQALTPEQESTMVDSIAQDLADYTDDLTQKADSVTADVDSLLQGI